MKELILKWASIFSLSIWFVIQSCNPVTLVKPLKSKQMAASASFGGPLIKFSGLVIPVPFTSLQLGYGLKEKTTITGGLNVTSLAFGVGQFDLGILQGIVNQDNSTKIGLSAYTKTHLLFDHWKSRFRWYPELGFNAYRQIGNEKNLLYAGASSWFETKFPKPERAAGNTWVPMLHIGYQRITEKWNFTYEVKWISPQTSNQNIVVDYIGAGQNGALGLYFGLTRKF